MARPRVLILCEDPGLAELVHADVARAGGTPVAAAWDDDLPRAAAVVAMGATEQLAALSMGAPAKTELILIGHDALPEMLPLFGGSEANHYIHRRAVEFVLYPTLRKFMSGDLFGVDKYLPASQARRLRVDSYAGRGLALDALTQGSNQLGIPRAMRLRILAACEQLIINALYNSPRDATGRAFFEDVPPRERLTLQSPSPISLRYAATDQQFVIGVRDRFGSLGKKTVLESLTKAIDRGDPDGPRVMGDGLGLHTVASLAETVAVNVAVGMATEVVCTFTADEPRLGGLGFFIHRREPVSTTASRRATPVA